MKSFITFLVLMCFFVHRSCGIKGGSAVKEPNFVAAVLKEKVDGAESTYELVAPGSVINIRFVLTAASCVCEHEAKFKVRVNSLDPNEGGEVIKVVEKREHEDYCNNHILNDIALLRLAKKIANPIEAVLSAPTEPELEGSIVYGWGTEQNKNDAKLVQLTAQPGNDETYCNKGKAVESEENNKKGLFCFKAKVDGIQFYSQQDRGAPLTILKDNVATVIALASLTELKNLRFFTPILLHEEWIYKNSNDTEDEITSTSTTEEDITTESITESTTTTKPIPTTEAPVTTKRSRSTKIRTTRTRRPIPKKKSGAPIFNAPNFKLLIAIVSSRVIPIFNWV